MTASAKITSFAGSMFYGAMLFSCLQTNTLGAWLALGGAAAAGMLIGAVALYRESRRRRQTVGVTLAPDGTARSQSAVSSVSGD